MVIVLISESWPLELGRGNISLASAGYVSVFWVGGTVDAFWAILIGSILGWVHRFNGLLSVATVALMTLTLQAAAAMAHLDPSRSAASVFLFAGTFVVVNHLLVNIYYLLRDGYVDRHDILKSLFWDTLGWGMSLPLAAIYLMLDLAHPHQWWVGALGMVPYLTISLLLSFYYQTRSSHQLSQRATAASESITLALSRDELVERVETAFSAALGFSIFALYLLDPATNVLQRASAVYPEGAAPYPDVFERGGASLTDWALSTRTPEFLVNTREMPSASPPPGDPHPLVSGFVLPLMTDRKIWGFIVMGYDLPNRYSRHEFEMAKVLAGYTAMTYRKWLLQEEALVLSRVDPLLPEVANFRYFSSIVSSRMAESPERAMALAVLDLDRFKQVNDRYGHMAGDHVLRVFAQLMQSELRDQDMFARYGGDEFVVLLDNVDASGASRALTRIQERFGGEHWADVEIPLGVSAGFALYPEDATTAESLLNLADLRMYHNKMLRKREFQDFPIE